MTAGEGCGTISGRTVPRGAGSELRGGEMLTVKTKNCTVAALCPWCGMMVYRRDEAVHVTDKEGGIVRDRFVVHPACWVDRLAREEAAR